VCEDGGEAAFSGRTEPWPVAPESSSGSAVHVLEFSALDAERDGWFVDVAPNRASSRARVAVIVDECSSTTETFASAPQPERRQESSRRRVRLGRRRRARLSG